MAKLSSTTVYGDLLVTADGKFNSDLDIGGNIAISNDLTMDGNAKIGEYIEIGPNSGGETLRVGGSGGGASAISLSNGNLHLDSGNSSNMYLNYYTTGTKVFFGKGTTAYYLGNNGDISAKTVTGALNGNANTSSRFLSTRANYKGVTDTSVVGELMWKKFGNNHTVFDASAGVSPNGDTIDIKTPTTGWANGYPTLMGWNGSQTYGVRTYISNKVDVSSGNVSSSWYDIAWHSGSTLYSSTGVEIQGSSNSIKSDRHYFAGNTYYMRETNGDYGTVSVVGGKGGWGGYSIDGRATFMHDGGLQTGLFNDVTNKWILKATQDKEINLYYNNNIKLATTNNGVTILGDSNITGNALVTGHTDTDYIYANLNSGGSWDNNINTGLVVNASDTSKAYNIVRVNTDNGFKIQALGGTQGTQRWYTNNANYIEFTGTTVKATLNGNASTATKLSTARTVTVAGDATGSFSFDGSANKTLTLAIKDNSHLHSNYAQKNVAEESFDGGTNTTININSDSGGASTLNIMGPNNGQGTGVLFVGQSPTIGGGIEYNGDNSPVTSGSGADYVTLYRKYTDGVNWTARNKNTSGGNDWEFRGNVKAASFTGNISGNAGTATKWKTARTLTTTLTGDVTGSASMSVDGSANKTVSVAVVIKDDSHNHDGRYYTESESNSRFAYKAGTSSQNFAVKDLTTTGKISITTNSTIEYNATENSIDFIIG